MSRGEHSNLVENVSLLQERLLAEEFTSEEFEAAKQAPGLHKLARSWRSGVVERCQWLRG